MLNISPEKERKLAIGWMLISAFSFAIMGAFVKVTTEVPLMEKVFFRNLVTFVLMLVVIIKKRENPFAQGRVTKYLILRALAGLTAVIMYFYAIANMTLADSTILNKLSPFFVIIFAGIFLKEGINTKKILEIGRASCRERV